MSKSNSSARAIEYGRRQQSRADKRLFSEFAVLFDATDDDLPDACARFAHDARACDDASVSRDALDRFSIAQSDL